MKFFTKSKVSQVLSGMERRIVAFALNVWGEEELRHRLPFREMKLGPLPTSVIEPLVAFVDGFGEPIVLLPPSFKNHDGLRDYSAVTWSDWEMAGWPFSIDSTVLQGPPQLGKDGVRRLAQTVLCYQYGTRWAVYGAIKPDLSHPKRGLENLRSLTEEKVLTKLYNSTGQFQSVLTAQDIVCSLKIRSQVQKWRKLAMRAEPYSARNYLSSSYLRRLLWLAGAEKGASSSVSITMQVERLWGTLERYVSSLPDSAQVYLPGSSSETSSTSLVTT